MKFVHAVFIDKEDKFDNHYIHQSGIPLLTEYVRSRKKKIKKKIAKSSNAKWKSLTFRPLSHDSLLEHCHCGCGWVAERTNIRSVIETELKLNEVLLRHWKVETFRQLNQSTKRFPRTFLQAKKSHNTSSPVKNSVWLLTTKRKFTTIQFVIPNN